MKAERYKRAEARKFRRIAVRFGAEKAEHRAMGIQISRRGMFLPTNHPIYAAGSKLIIEIQGPTGIFTVTATVGHSKKYPRKSFSMSAPEWEWSLSTCRRSSGITLPRYETFSFLQGCNVRFQPFPRKIGGQDLLELGSGQWQELQAQKGADHVMVPRMGEPISIAFSVAGTK
jgi:hypothetical protein